MVAGQEINFPGWVGGWVEGIGNKAQLRPAKAGAWPELGKILELSKGKIPACWNYVVILIL